MDSGRGSDWNVEISGIEVFLAQYNLQMHTHAKNSKHSKMLMVKYAKCISP